MKLKPIVAAVAVIASFASYAESQITIVNFGGANGIAQKKAYFEPYEKNTGNKIVGVAYNGEQAKIKAMVETKKVTWDVVEVESPDVARGCDEGLFEKLDYSIINTDDLPRLKDEAGNPKFCCTPHIMTEVQAFLKTASNKDLKERSLKRIDNAYLILTLLKSLVEHSQQHYLM